MLRPDANARRRAAIAAGGVAGAALRWFALTGVGSSDGLPWAVLALNVAGSFLLGVLLAEEPAHPQARLALHDAGAIGFCGGLTTFSTFSLEVVLLARDGASADAVAYVVLSVALAIGGILAGAALRRRVGATMRPVEEEL